MKYMTKEWYETMQKKSYPLLVKISDRAESFSEAYFRELYSEEEAEWLKMKKGASEIKTETLFPENFEAKAIDGTPLNPELKEMIETAFRERREYVLEHEEELRSKFDLDRERCIFRANYRRYLRRLKDALPEEIQKNIADIRVLALRRASAAVIEAITAFCEGNRKKVEATMRAYDDQYEKNFIHGDPSFMKNFGFHDCKIISCRRRGEDLVLQLDNSGGFSNIQQIIFKKCAVLKKDKGFRGAWWLYEEVYPTNGGYEIHVLLQGKQMIDFIVTALDVQYDDSINTENVV